jgi:hypothetical protein
MGPDVLKIKTDKMFHRKIECPYMVFTRQFWILFQFYIWVTSFSEFSYIPGNLSV